MDNRVAPMIQLSLSSTIRHSKGSFGAQRHAWARRRILAGELHRLPASWRISGWVVARLLATPPWADFTEIRKVYDEAARLTWLTGIDHEVDHEVPLNHPRVCGLHVHNNLRVMAKKPNNAKSNKWCPEQMELFDD